MQWKLLATGMCIWLDGNSSAEQTMWARMLQYKSRKIQPWLAEIADTDFVPQLHPGDQLPVSDALSWLPNPQAYVIKDEQERDPLILYARKCLAFGTQGEARPVDLENNNTHHPLCT